jgi:Fe-S oxidoreductase
VRRFGEETLFMALREHNTEAIKASGVQRIVTSDPHAYNALKHDYKDVPPVEHISEVIARKVQAGDIKLNPLADDETMFTPTTIPATWGGTTASTMRRAMCWMPFPD